MSGPVLRLLYTHWSFLTILGEVHHFFINDIPDVSSETRPTILTIEHWATPH